MLGKRLIRSNDEGGSCTDPFADQTQLAFYKFNNSLADENGNHTLTTNTASFSTGQFNQSLQFVYYTYARGGNLTQPVPLSLSFWHLRTTTGTAVGQLINKRTGPYDGWSVTSNYDSVNNQALLGILEGGGWASGVGGIGAFPVNTWTHFVVNLTSSGFTSFINGSPAGSYTQSITGGSIALTYGYLSMANWVGTDGKLDQLRVFNRTLNQTEANYLYTTDSACG